jgi:hypothetical protein
MSVPPTVRRPTRRRTSSRIWPTPRDAYKAGLKRAGRGRITTEIAPAPTFYFAEADDQQYLAKNPHGYCGRRRLRHSAGRQRLTGTVFAVRQGSAARLFQKVKILREICPAPCKSAA